MTGLSNRAAHLEQSRNPNGHELHEQAASQVVGGHEFPNDVAAKLWSLN